MIDGTATNVNLLGRDEGNIMKQLFIFIFIFAYIVYLIDYSTKGNQLADRLSDSIEKFIKLQNQRLTEECEESYEKR